jgi:hypothetical protein
MRMVGAARPSAWRSFPVAIIPGSVLSIGGPVAASGPFAPGSVGHRLARSLTLTFARARGRPILFS